MREKRRLTLAAKLVEAPLQLVALVLGPLRRVHLRELGRLGNLGLMLLPPLGELLGDDRVHVGVGVPRLLLVRALPVRALLVRALLRPRLGLPLGAVSACLGLLALLSCHQSHSLSPHVTALRLGLRHGAFIVVTSRTSGWGLHPGRPLPAKPHDALDHLLRGVATAAQELLVAVIHRDGRQVVHVPVPGRARAQVHVDEGGLDALVAQARRARSSLCRARTMWRARW